MWNTALLFVLAAVSTVAHSNVLPEESERSLPNSGQFNIYYLYTRYNTAVPTVLRMSSSSVLNSWFDPNRDTAVIVHGHRANAYNSLNPSVKDAYLQSYDANVIVVDWEVFAGQSYSNAVGSVPAIGEGIAQLLSFLVQFGLRLERVHLVGFDLGAHVVGFTGRYLGGRVARITGLSPSGSRWGSRSGHLNKDDAVYVEVIHSDRGITGNGINDDVGNVDYFPNGGSNQPGCLLNSCDHDRSWELFAASLSYNHFVGRRCRYGLQLSLNSCDGEILNMGNGYLVKPHISGYYRVNTASRYPF